MRHPFLMPARARSGLARRQVGFLLVVATGIVGTGRDGLVFFNPYQFALPLDRLAAAVLLRKPSRRRIDSFATEDTGT